MTARISYLPPLATLDDGTLDLSFSGVGNGEEEEDLSPTEKKGVTLNGNPNIGVPKLTAHRDGFTAPHIRKATPPAYAALLSDVSKKFLDRITPRQRLRNGKTYQNAFDGREAVSKLQDLAGINERNVALLLGRSLGQQRLFKCVTVERQRLKDARLEMYRFSSSITTSTNPASAHLPILPSGVFTLLTDCYSPTCFSGQSCFTVFCARKLKFTRRSNDLEHPYDRPPLRIINVTQESEQRLNDSGIPIEPGALWIHSVPKNVSGGLSHREQLRQEVIHEVISTERMFVRDLEYVRDVWIKPLLVANVIPEPRLSEFIKTVFWNLEEILSLNTGLRDVLCKRQWNNAIVKRIGDAFLDFTPHFEPFVEYGKHQIYGRSEFQREKSTNPAFERFVKETERRPESRMLELNGYLTKPTTRLARYPLLLEQVLKHTSDDNPDRMFLPQAIASIKLYLHRLNVESGKAENVFNLLELNRQLHGEVDDLDLINDNRKFLFKGNLELKNGSVEDNGEVLVYLLDHALLMVKRDDQHDRVFRKPIPLQFLQVQLEEHIPVPPPKIALPKPSKPTVLTRRISLKPQIPPAFTTDTPNPEGEPRTSIDNTATYPITFTRLGRSEFSVTLHASSFIARKKWHDHITHQQYQVTERVFRSDTDSLMWLSFADRPNSIRCAVPFDAGRRLAIGTDEGIYFADLTEYHREPVKVFALPPVRQIDVIESYGLLITLADGEVTAFSLEMHGPKHTPSGVKRGKKLSTLTSFFTIGTCSGHEVLSLVRASWLSTTIKVLMLVDPHDRGYRKPAIRKFIPGSDTLRVLKEFYIPMEVTSLYYLKNKLCVGTTKGFYIVDFETFETQRLIDPTDASLEFVDETEGSRPLAIFRVDNEFLLCYSDRAFYVDKGGRSSGKLNIMWEGNPTAFVLKHPYILAFEPSFVEVRDLEDGHIVQVMKVNNLRLLYAPPLPLTSPFGSSSSSGQVEIQSKGSVKLQSLGSAVAKLVNNNSPLPHYPGIGPLEVAVIASHEGLKTLHLVIDSE